MNTDLIQLFDETSGTSTQKSKDFNKGITFFYTSQPFFHCVHISVFKKKFPFFHINVCIYSKNQKLDSQVLL